MFYYVGTSHKWLILSTWTCITGFNLQKCKTLWARAVAVLQHIWFTVQCITKTAFQSVLYRNTSTQYFIAGYVKSIKKENGPLYTIHKKTLCDRTQPLIGVVSQQLINISKRHTSVQDLIIGVLESELCV